MRITFPVARQIAAVTAVTAATLGFLAPGIASAVTPDGGDGRDGGRPVTFALLGDTPYGDAQRTVFPALVKAVNGDPKVRFVLHAGDIKRPLTG